MTDLTLQVLREALEVARECGEPFTAAWHFAIAEADPPDDWPEILDETRAAWQDAYELRPAVRSELACGYLVRGEGAPDLDELDAELAPTIEEREPLERPDAIPELALDIAT